MLCMIHAWVILSLFDSWYFGKIMIAECTGSSAYWSRQFASSNFMLQSLLLVNLQLERYFPQVSARKWMQPPQLEFEFRSPIPHFKMLSNRSARTSKFRAPGDTRLYDRVSFSTHDSLGKRIFAKGYRYFMG